MTPVERKDFDALEESHRELMDAATALVARCLQSNLQHRDFPISELQTALATARRLTEERGT